MEQQTVAVLVVTYNRADILSQTLARLHEYLDYPALSYVIADDGSTDGTMDLLADEYPHAHVTHSNRRGLGGNANAGLERVFAEWDIVLQIQDDMWLQRRLELAPHVERLARDPTAGYIRLWGVGGHAYQASLDKLPDYGAPSFWRIWWHSPELYIASDRPHIKHRRFHDQFGHYPEGLRTDQTEDAWCHQCKDRAGANGVVCDVLVPHSLDIETLWEHGGWHSRWRDVGL